MTVDTVATNIPVEKQPGELVNAITSILQRMGHTRPSDWTRGLHPDAHATTDENIQRFLINRQFRQILGTAPVKTMDERYCLVDQGGIKDWLRLFETGVAPCLIANNLPPALN